jgi:hypothetical protein
MPTGRSFIASSTSVQVISDITIRSAMAIEGRLLRSFPVLCSWNFQFEASRLRS